MKVKIKSDAIKRILAEKNHSQNWLANKIGTSSGYMSQMLTGMRNPSPEMREEILKAFKEDDFNKFFYIENNKKIKEAV